MGDTAYPFSSAAWVIVKFARKNAKKKDNNLEEMVVAAFSIAYRISCENREIMDKSDGFGNLNERQLFCELYYCCGLEAYDTPIDVLGYIDKAYDF